MPRKENDTNRNEKGKSDIIYKNRLEACVSESQHDEVSIVHTHTPKGNGHVYISLVSIIHTNRCKALLHHHQPIHTNLIVG